MTGLVRFYGLADLQTGEVVDFYLDRAEAEKALTDAPADEPDRLGQIGVVLVVVDFRGAEPMVETVTLDPSG